MMRFLIALFIFSVGAAAETKPTPTQAEQDEIWRKAMEESNRIRQQGATPAQRPTMPVPEPAVHTLSEPAPEPVKPIAAAIEIPWIPIGKGEVRITSWRIGKVRINKFSGVADSTDDMVIIHLEVRNPDPAKILRYASWRTELFKVREEGTAGLKDDIGNNYRRIYVGFGESFEGATASMNEDVYPGKSVSDVLVFSRPVDAAKTLILSLPAFALGGTKSIEQTLRIER